MESQSFQNFPIPQPINLKQRSLPIPKVVNQYILNNYGAAYYSSQSITEKQAILKNIETECINSGYVNIRAEEIERRLKNMKSHYRRKKQELELGASKNVVWEYFDVIDGIFSEIDKNRVEEVPAPVLVTPKVEATVVQKQTVEAKIPGETYTAPTSVLITPKDEKIVAQKRELEVEAPGENAPKPEDLSIKRPRIIEFCNISEISNQISVNYPTSPSPASTSSSSQSTSNLQQPPNTPVTEVSENRQSQDIQITIASLKFIDQQRLEVNRQLVALETYRCQLDTFGCHLNQELIKMMQAKQSSEN